MLLEPKPGLSYRTNGFIGSSRVISTKAASPPLGENVLVEPRLEELVEGAQVDSLDEGEAQEDEGLASSRKGSLSQANRVFRCGGRFWQESIPCFFLKLSKKRSLWRRHHSKAGRSGVRADDSFDPRPPSSGPPLSKRAPLGVRRCCSLNHSATSASGLAVEASA